MINEKLFNPQSIVVVGASTDTKKPGGKILKNIIDKKFKGSLFVVNPSANEVQGIRAYNNVDEIPTVDLAVIAIPPQHCYHTMEILLREKQTKAFVVISAGFSEESPQGAIYERCLVELVNSYHACMIGPNCAGIVTAQHASVFTTPVPDVTHRGCDFVSGSGAITIYTMGASMPNGLKFNNVFSIGNSAQISTEDILEYLDNTFDEQNSAKIKLLYIENIRNPHKLLKHSVSLIAKGCRIAAIKSGGSESGSRAASSHTGAMATPDVAIEALFSKAGIVRCSGREELATVAGIFTYPQLKGNNIAIITHAGGPAVMLTDVLSESGFSVPKLDGKYAQEMQSKLNLGASVGNPIDMIATATAEQLAMVIDYCEHHFDNIDAIVVIFGTPGLKPIFDAYNVLHEKMETCKKVIFPVLPSISTAKEELDDFITKGHVNFPDEVIFGQAMAKIHRTKHPEIDKINYKDINLKRIKAVIDNASDGYLLPCDINTILETAHIPIVKELSVNNESELKKAALQVGYPLVMKVVGPLHKSDVGGVVLNVLSDEQLVDEYLRMIKIPETTAVLLQSMLCGTELYIGAKYEERFGHIVLCGLGGIFVEVLKDVASGLSPLNTNEAITMIKSLKGYNIFNGIRNQAGVDEGVFAEIITRLSYVLQYFPEIKELDFNPLLGIGKKITVVDARVRIDKNKHCLYFNSNNQNIISL